MRVKKPQKVTVFLKSGASFEVHCENVQANYTLGQLVSLKFEGVTHGHAFYIDVSQVAAIVWDEIEEWEGAL